MALAASLGENRCSGWGEQWRQVGGDTCGRRITPMKHERRMPAWLFRDLPALAGMFACFWLFVIPLITEGFASSEAASHRRTGSTGSRTRFSRLKRHCLMPSVAKPTAASATIRSW